MISRFRLMNPAWVFQRLTSYRKVRKARDSETDDPVHICLFGQSIIVRPNGPDFRVAVSTLGCEFDPLIGLFPRAFSGVIVDAGGFIGTAAIRLSQIYPNATIVTVEPSNENFKLLKVNVREHPNIHAIHAALVPKKGGSYHLYDRGTGAWGFTIVEEPKDQNNALAMHEIDTITLEEISDMFKDLEISIVKLDIEGGEKFLFDAGDPWLLRSKVVFAELHDRIVPGCSDSFRSFSHGRKVSKPGREKYLAIKLT